MVKENDLTPDKRRVGRARIWLRWAVRLTALAFALIGLAILFWLRGALYHRFVRFPREEAAWQGIRAARQPVTENAGWNEYRGILHSHSHLSHDSEVPFEEILRAMDVAQLDFICLSDHPDAGRANFALQWRGLHDGKLFIPGFEMRDGMMPFGVASSVTVSNQADNATLARQIVGNGGVLFYAHPEEPRDWNRPELTGMEIYNLHADFKRHRGGVGGALRDQLPDAFLNLGKYPDHVFRLAFHRPTEFLEKWDQLNQTRHLTGIAGNDCHQNVGLRGFYTTNGTIRIEDTSPKTLAELRLNGLTRLMARGLFGPLEPGRRLFHLQLDPYERSARFVNTHVLAKELSEIETLEALRAGRVFIGFDMIADSSGFRWFARDGDRPTVMGESGALSGQTRLHAVSPIPCRFTIVQDGKVVHRAEGRALDWKPPGPGNYRVEAELKIRDEWTPWVYANPIRLK